MSCSASFFSESEWVEPVKARNDPARLGTNGSVRSVVRRPPAKVLALPVVVMWLCICELVWASVSDTQVRTQISVHCCAFQSFLPSKSSFDLFEWNEQMKRKPNRIERRRTPNEAEKGRTRRLGNLLPLRPSNRPTDIRTI